MRVWTRSILTCSLFCLLAYVNHGHAQCDPNGGDPVFIQKDRRCTVPDVNTSCGLENDNSNVVRALATERHIWMTERDEVVRQMSSLIRTLAAIREEHLELLGDDSPPLAEDLVNIKD